MKKQILPIIVANILFWSTIVFFTPLNIFLNNRIEFSFSLTIIVIQTIIITVVCIIVSSILSIYLFKKHQALLVSILIILSVLAWIQSNLIVVDLGVFDGRAINWNQYSLSGLADLAMWLIFLILAKKYSGFLKKYIFTIASALIIIQSISTSINFTHSPPDPEFKDSIVDETNKFTFSTKKNIIIIVLDSFQSNYFHQVIKEHPQFLEQLTGFTYFPNTTGGFNTTYPSIPLILTGQYYDNSQPIQEFITEAFHKTSLPKFLKNEGFQNDIYPLATATIPLNPELIDNLPSKTNINKLVDTSKLGPLAYLTWFRIAPQYIKPNIYQVESLVTNSTYRQAKFETIDFLQDLKKKIKVANIQEQFKFYHLFGLHLPLTTNEELQRKAMTYTPENYARATLGSVKMIKEIINTFKESGIYDESIIVIAGDHGIGMPIDEEPVTGISEQVRALGQPLLLVKPANSSEKMSIVDTPVTIGDIYKSIATAINPEKSEEIPGLDVFTNNVPPDRDRQYFHYVWRNNWNTQGYLPPMRKYTISGDTSNPLSWHDTGDIYQKGTMSSFEADYELGTNIDFESEQADKYMISGWSGNWSVGKQAVLEFDKLPINKDLILTIDVTPFSKQDVEILVNNNQLDKITFTGKTNYRVHIPQNIITGKQDRITFNISAPISPYEHGTSTDVRKLGILIRTLTISEVPLYTLNKPIHFTAHNYNADQWRTSGWSSPEINGTWSLGTSTSLVINVPDLNKQNAKTLHLKAVIQPLTKAPELTKQLVEVSINNKVIGKWDVDVAQEYSMAIPTDTLSNPHLHITFTLPNAASPASLGMNTDTRKLGILFKELKIETQ